MSQTSFNPPRGGRGSQLGDGKPVPSAYWQEPERVERNPDLQWRRGAILLGWSGHVPIGVQDDRHILMAAGARAGKTSTLLTPNLLLYPGSTIVLDPKGELASKTALHRADTLGHRVHVLDPWRAADVPDRLRSTFDPLGELLDTDPDAVADRVDDAALIAEALIQDAGQDNSHWTAGARDLIRALVLWVALDAELSGGIEALPELIARCMAVDDRPPEEGGTPPEENPFNHMEQFARTPGLQSDVADVIRNAAKTMRHTQSRERASILSTAARQLGFLESGPLRANLKSSQLRLRDLMRGAPTGTFRPSRDGGGERVSPLTVYLCLPATRMDTHARWLRLILNQTIAALEREGRRFARAKRKPKFPILLMLEEFAALGHMRALEQAAAYMAGFHVKMWTVVQDLTQLKRHYKDGWETFCGNAGVFVAFGNSDMTTLEYVSKRLGQCAVYVEEDQDLNEGDAKAGRSGVKRNFQRVPLLAPDEVATQFGRSSRRAIVQIADKRPIALHRRFADDPAFAPILNAIKP